MCNTKHPCGLRCCYLYLLAHCFERQKEREWGGGWWWWWWWIAAIIIAAVIAVVISVVIAVVVAVIIAVIIAAIIIAISLVPTVSFSFFLSSISSSSPRPSQRTDTRSLSTIVPSVHCNDIHNPERGQVSNTQTDASQRKSQSPLRHILPTATSNETRQTNLSGSQRIVNESLAIFVSPPALSHITCP